MEPSPHDPSSKAREDRARSSRGASCILIRTWLQMMVQP